MNWDYKLDEPDREPGDYASDGSDDNWDASWNASWDDYVHNFIPVQESAEMELQCAIDCGAQEYENERYVFHYTLDKRFGLEPDIGF